MISRDINRIMLFIIYMMMAMIAHSTALGDDINGKISPISKGEKAAIDGYILDIDALSYLTSTVKMCDERTKLEVDKAVGLEKAKIQYDLDVMTADRDMWKDKYDSMLTLKTEHITYLEKELKRLSKPDRSLPLFVAGVLVGTGMVVAGGILISGIAVQFPN